MRDEGVVAIRPASATSHVDSVAAGASLACYLVAAISAEGRIAASSDLLCVLPGAATGFAARNFTLQLNQSPVAVLTWELAPGASAYVLLPIGTERVQLLPAAAASATDNTSGEVTCSVLLAQFGSTASGISAVLCGVPGAATGLEAPR